MGLYFRYPAAFLIALLAICSSTQLHAATRKYVSLPSNGSVVGSGSAARSGDSLIITGQPLDGEYIPSSYGGGSKGTKLPIKPKYDYSIRGTTVNMAKRLRAGGLAGVGLTLGLEWMLDQVGGFIDENGQPVKRVPDDGSGYQPSPTELQWYMAKPHASMPTQPISGTASGVCAIYGKAFAAGYTGVTYVGSSISGEKATQANCKYQWSENGVVSSATSVAFRTGEICPAGYERVGNGCVKSTSGTVPLTDADYNLMQAAAAAKDSDWLKDRLREHCEGSLAPESCYEELRTSTQLEGPSTITEKGPTTTTTGPGGTTSTTNNTKIDITYGDNYYDYRKTSTVTKTNPDGTTETETSTDPEEVTEEQEQDEGDIQYSDADMPEVEPFYQQKYPDGLAGVWQSVSSNIESSAFLAFLSSFVPNFSGSCPTFSLQFNIASWANYGTISFWNMCWIFEFIKTVLIVSAVFLARALTFGG